MANIGTDREVVEIPYEDDDPVIVPETAPAEPAREPVPA